MLYYTLDKSTVLQPLKVGVAWKAIMTVRWQVLTGTDVKHYKETMQMLESLSFLLQGHFSSSGDVD